MRISWRHSNAQIDDSWRYGGILPLRADSIFAAAAMMSYSGGDVELVIYLCLKNTVPDILLVTCFFHPQLPASIVFGGSAHDI